MNNNWIEWEGGEPELVSATVVDVIFNDGEQMDKVAVWEVDFDQVVKYRLYVCQSDPHKEWVRIQEGCPMPAEKEEVVIFDGECQFDCEYQCHMTFVENTEQVVFNELPLWWRHRPLTRRFDYD